RRGASLLDVAHVSFGEQRVIPTVTLLADGVRYSGATRRGAFRWQFDLAYSKYPLTTNGVTQWIDGDAASEPFTRRGTFAEYLLLGITHIIPLGADHILFVLGMFLITRRAKDVLAQVTAFTLAHSITLALAMYGVVSVPGRIVEPLIALSIVFIAVENLIVREVSPRRVALVFTFGLLHGLGFAGVLRELGGDFVTALVAFNAGVELGQLAVIAAAWLLVTSWTRERVWYRRRVLVPASVMIAAMGLVWMIERI
ncbi:MAG TPA: HupE/UreJ family protein, partial [Thermoanaerobaculia bacterium]|nr:HupE/UreJ family protein [Thermoanaerobaculia bacterium]